MKNPLCLVAMCSLILSVSAPASAAGLRPDGENLFNSWNADYRATGGQREQIAVMNERELAELNALVPTASDPDRVFGIKPHIAAQLHEAGMNHPVASPWMVPAWDPGGKIGFCFGRAMFIDLESRFRGIDSNGIRKAWVVGSLVSGSTQWGWHVTTLVWGGSQQGWLAIDPIFEGPMPVKAWYEKMKNDFNSAKGDMRIYFSDSKKFGPSGGQYHPQALKDGFYNDYFMTLTKVFRMASHRAQELRNSPTSPYVRQPKTLRKSSMNILKSDPELVRQMRELSREISQRMNRLQ